MLKVNDTCIGCGACVAIAPENFDYQEGISVVTNETVTDKTKEAIDACPVGAIEVTDASTEKAENANDDMPMAA